VGVGAADAAPHGVRLTYSGDPATTIAISWTSTSAAENTVLYGTSATDLTQTLVAQQTFAQGAPLTSSATATLSGLAPATTYFYRVGIAGNYQPPVGQPPFQFTTLSDDPCAPFTFVLIGDNRADFDGVGAAPVWSEILDETLVHAPAFFVNTGDMVKNGEDPTEWAGFIDDSEKGWALVPSILTIGNHDDQDDNGPGSLYSQLFELPTNSANGWENYYSVDAGPIHFVSLDSNARGTELTQMAAWLSADLAGTTQPWKMVFFHHAIYSRGNHFTGEESSGLLNKTLIPIFDQHDVDFVFNGHSHNYERYAPTVGVDPAWDGSATPRAFPAGNGAAFPPGSMVPDGATGTTYLVAGGAGALTTEVAGIECIDAGCTLCLGLFPIGDCDGDVWARDKTGTAVYEGKHNYVVFRVDGGTIEADMHTTNAGNSGSGAIGDSFAMTSADIAQQCATAGVPDAGPGPGAIDAATDPPADADTGPGIDGAEAGGCCGTGSGDAPGALALCGLVLLALRRRR
jgi:uncharacterized protein (TIGR03382 family)